MKLIALLSLLGLATSLAAPLRLTELHTQSPWIAHLDTAKLRKSPLRTFLQETAGFDQFLTLKSSLKEKLSLDLDTIDGVTLIASGDQWKDTSFLVRGRFGESDFASLPRIEDNEKDKDTVIIRKGPQVHQNHLYLTRHSENELIVGTTPQAVRDGVVTLTKPPARFWGTEDLNEDIRTKLASATALFGIDMKSIGNEVDFEAELTRSMRSAWFLIGSKGDEIEVTFLINSTDLNGLTFLSERWTLFSTMLATGPDTPETVRKSMAAQKVTRHDHWMSITMVAPPNEADQFLKTLAPLFGDDSKNVTAPK